MLEQCLKNTHFKLFEIQKTQFQSKETNTRQADGRTFKIVKLLFATSFFLFYLEMHLVLVLSWYLADLQRTGKWRNFTWEFIVFWRWWLFVGDEIVLWPGLVWEIKSIIIVIVFLKIVVKESEKYKYLLWVV